MTETQRVAVVTGAARGTGNAMTRGLLRRASGSLRSIEIVSPWRHSP
jgi:NAD(P)-dependent dehydrogenase (short-subunit alcohol dehydrogenase family)